MITGITRQGLEQSALLLVIGAAVFGLLALRAYRRGDHEGWRRPALSAGGLVLLAVVALGAGYTVAPNIPTPPVPITARFAQNPVADTPEAWAAGRAAYNARCAVCHGPQGLGDGPAAFTLNPRPFNLQVHTPQHAPGEVYHWISEGIPGTAMPPWKDVLDETERWSLVRFLYALADGRARSTQ